MSSESEDPAKIRLPDTDKALPKHVVTGYYHYTSFEDLTEGGAASLQVCYDKNLCRNVAIKKLHPHLKDSEMEQRRFLREARVTAQIQHPNTVPVYELGRDDKGELYFTMKRLQGRDLRDVIRALSENDPATAEAYPLEQLVEVLIQVCRAVAYAHRQGVIHRDLKPANIQVGSFGEVMVLDWGLAKVFAEEIDEAAEFQELPKGSEPASLELTRPGRRYGTPLYMSPEQAEGRTDVDERCDIYNLGLILYEMLTWEQVVHGETVDEVLEKVLKEQPVPPRQRAPERDIPPELEAVCLKALEKKPEDRYASVVDLINELTNFQREIPVDVYADPPLQRLLKWRHRHLLSTTSILSFLLGVLLTLVVVWLLR